MVDQTPHILKWHQQLDSHILFSRSKYACGKPLLHDAQATVAKKPLKRINHVVVRYDKAKRGSR